MNDSIIVLKSKSEVPAGYVPACAIVPEIRGIATAILNACRDGAIRHVRVERARPCVYVHEGDARDFIPRYIITTATTKMRGQYLTLNGMTLEALIASTMAPTPESQPDDEQPEEINAPRLVLALNTIADILREILDVQRDISINTSLLLQAWAPGPQVRVGEHGGNGKGAAHA